MSPIGSDIDTVNTQLEDFKVNQSLHYSIYIATVFIV